MKLPFQRNLTASRWDEGEEKIEPPEPLVMPQPVNPGFYDPSWDDWNEKDNRWIRRVAIALLVLAVLFAAAWLLKPIIKSAVNPPSSTTTIPSKADSPSVFHVPEAPSQAPSVTFNGAKAGLTSEFTAPSGLAIITYSCTCEASFSISVIDAQGTAAAIPVNSPDSGKLAGTAPMVLPAGNYSADVGATGKWSVTISFPTTTTSLPLPFVKQLTGSEVVGPFPAGKPVTVGYASFWASNATVSIHVMDLQGKMGTEILSTAALGGKEANLQAQDSPYYLVADGAPGSWILRVSPGSSS